MGWRGAHDPRDWDPRRVGSEEGGIRRGWDPQAVWSGVRRRAGSEEDTFGCVARGVAGGGHSQLHPPPRVLAHQQVELTEVGQ